ncbi:MAG: hypothetical protein ABID83_05910 [Candidatus Omnitrophota bacterium]
MKAIGNFLALIGIILFIYTVVVKFVPAASVISLSKIPVLSNYVFTPVGLLSGTACILLIAVIALLKGK